MGRLTYVVTDGENVATTKDKEMAYGYMEKLMDSGLTVEVIVTKEDDEWR